MTEPSTKGQQRYLAALMSEAGIKPTRAHQARWIEMTEAEADAAIKRAMVEIQDLRLSRRTPQPGEASNRALRYLFTLYSECRLVVTRELRDQWWHASKADVRAMTHGLQRRRIQIQEDYLGFPQEWRQKRGWA